MVRLVREVALVAALLLLYRAGRLLGRDSVTEGFAHAVQIVRWERWLGVGTELDLQRWVLGHRWLVMASNRYYAQVHFPVSMAFLVFMYLRRAPHYLRVRWVFALVTAVGLVGHLAYPLAPPRMLPGFVDTISRFGPAIYDRSDVAAVANQYAAMPSLHFGWAVIVAWGVISTGRSPWRWLLVVHPVATLFAIVATANHYWADPFVAGVLVALAIPVTTRFAATDGGEASSAEVRWAAAAGTACQLPR